MKTKLANYVILIIFMGLMIYASFGLPNRGDNDAFLNREKSPAGSDEAAAFYIHNPKRDANTDNMVTVILADYRGYDTLGEESVIFTAGMICFLLLRKRREE